MIELLNYLLFGIFILFVEIIYLRIAKFYNITDHPNDRSSHQLVTIRGGGIIFPITILFYSLMSGFKYPFFSIGLFLISFISFWDDLHTASNKIRIFVHLIAVTFLFVELRIENTNLALIILSYIIVIGIINAYNFMDGINGMTGLYSLSFFITLILISSNSVNLIDTRFLICATLSILIFLFFNYRKKAKCFAGDVGSVSMAFIVIFALVYLINETHQLLYLLFLSVYGVDTILTIMVRLYQRENIFQAHRSHVYQLLSNERSYGHKRISLAYAFIQCIINCLVLYYINMGLDTLYSIVFTFGIILSLTAAYFYIRRETQLLSKLNL